MTIRRPSKMPVRGLGRVLITNPCLTTPEQAFPHKPTSLSAGHSPTWRAPWIRGRERVMKSAGYHNARTASGVS